MGQLYRGEGEGGAAAKRVRLRLAIHYVHDSIVTVVLYIIIRFHVFLCSVTMGQI
jgi:hypothetical protein